jgi:hypothetical protein
MDRLYFLNLDFVENYIGDDGITILSEVVSKMQNIKILLFNMGFNDAKSYGMINSVKNLAKKNFDYLFLGLSNN